MRSFIDGDCAGTGYNSEACVEECGGFNSSPTPPSTDSKEIAEAYFIGLRDLLGYEVYRDNSLLNYFNVKQVCI